MTDDTGRGPLSRFVRRHLDPADRLAEALCGLIMVLSFTLVAAKQVAEGPKGVRQLLLATIGCNLAWGIIDGALYVLSAMTQRGQRVRIFQEVKACGDEASAVARIEAEMDDRMPAEAPPGAKEAYYRAMVPIIAAAPKPPRLVTAEDLLGGLGILAVEIACTLPAALPFLIFGDREVALRVSNGLLLVMLFLIGYKYGDRAMGRGWLTGTVMLLLGAALVGVALALGG